MNLRFTEGTFFNPDQAINLTWVWTIGPNNKLTDKFNKYVYMQIVHSCFFSLQF